LTVYLAPLLLNSALAAVKIQPSSSFNAQIAVKNATRALSRLELSPADKAKALYRRALAKIILKDDEDAEKDLADAVALVPADQAAPIAAELAKTKQRKKEKRDKEKKAFKKMFA